MTATPRPQSTDWVRCRWCWWKVPRVTRQKGERRSGYYLLALHAQDTHPAEYAEVAAAESTWLQRQGVTVDYPESVTGFMEAREALTWKR